MPKVSLSEIMGKKAAGKGSSLSLNDLPDILGDSMPELPRNSVGRFRLTRALQQRFGNNFRRLPGVSGLMTQFDDDVKFEQRIASMQKLKGPKKGT